MCCLTHLVFKVVGPGLAVLDPPICGPAYWETKANDIVSSVQVTHLILFYSSKLICWHFALKQYLWVPLFAKAFIASRDIFLKRKLASAIQVFGLECPISELLEISSYRFKIAFPADILSSQAVVKTFVLLDQSTWLCCGFKVRDNSLPIYFICNLWVTEIWFALASPSFHDSSCSLHSRLWFQSQN